MGKKGNYCLSKNIQLSCNLNEYTWLKFKDFGRLTPTRESDFENNPCLWVTINIWMLLSENKTKSTSLSGFD